MSGEEQTRVGKRHLGKWRKEDRQRGKMFMYIERDL